MKHFKTLLLYTLVLSLILTQATFATGVDSDVKSPQKMMMVRSFQNIDFPSATNLNANALTTEIEELVAFAQNAGFDSILFEARPEGDSLYKSEHFPKSRYLVKEQGAFTAFDPLKELIDEAKEKGIDVYAAVNPYYLGKQENIDSKHWALDAPELTLKTEAGLFANPSSDKVIEYNAEDIADMVKSYDIAGVLISGIDAASLLSTDNYEANLQKLMAEIDDKMGNKKLAISLDKNSFSAEGLNAITAQTDIIFSDIALNGYMSTLTALEKTGNEVISILDINATTGISSSLTTKVIEGSGYGRNEYLYSGYQALKENKNQQTNLLFTLSKADITFPNYNPAQSLTITRPTNKLTTELTKFYITGTSDPSQPVTLNGNTVERFTNDGIFGELVSLQMGDNHFSFQNGGVTKNVVITRIGPAAARPITDIRSAYPISSAITKNQASLAISCIAPAGATVTASIAGQQVALTQNVAASPGIPATFSGKVVLSGADSEEVKKIGAITYTLSYNGSTTNYPSNGSVYLMGESARAIMQVWEYTAVVYQNSNLTEGAYKADYKKGTREEIVSQLGEYYELASGGYVRKNQVTVQSTNGYNPIEVNSVKASHTAKSERFILEDANAIPYTIEFGESGAIRVTLHGDLKLPSDIDTTSELMSSITWSRDGGDLICNITPKDPAKVWGADILYDGDDAILYFKKAPKLSTDPLKPLTGVHIAVDSGHGGVDPGALGVLGVEGPVEKELNLANGILLKDRLEDLGATVTMTRTNNDQTISLYERVEVVQNSLPDLFIALHHNSVPYTTDADTAAGVEVYFYEGISVPIASSVYTSLSTATQRRQRRLSYNYFVVTRMTHTPSILAEIGFLSNAAEYKDSCDPTSMYKTADSLATAVMKTIDDAN